MSHAVEGFGAVLEQALVQLHKGMAQQGACTAVVLTANRAADAATLLTHWRQCAPPKSRLHLVFFEDKGADLSNDSPVAGASGLDSPGEGGVTGQQSVADHRAVIDQLLSVYDEAGVKLLPGVHRFEAQTPGVTATRLIGPWTRTLSQLVASVDIILIDSTHPLAHIPHYADSLLRTAGPDLTVLAPDLVIGQLQAAIRHKGAKTMATHALRSPWQLMQVGLHRPAKPAATATRTAWVVGGSLAGAGVAHALALRGWQVHVTDPALAEGQAGPQAGHLAAALTPLISVDDNVKARLSRAGVYRAHQRWADFGPDIIPSRSGTLELARTKGHARDLLQAVQAMGYPEDWVRLVARAQGPQVAGVTVMRQGAYFAKGMTVSPPLLIRRLLSHPNICCHGFQIETLAKGPGGWQLRYLQGNDPMVAAECDTVILAAAASTPALLARSGLDQRMRKSGRREPVMPVLMSMETLGGQVMHVPDTLLPAVPASVVGAEGYFLPPVDGQCVLGTTYERQLSSLGCTRSGQRQIVRKLAPALAPAALQTITTAIEAATCQVSPGAVSGNPLPVGSSAGEVASGSSSQERVSGAIGSAGAVCLEHDAPVFPGWSGNRAVIRGRLPAFGPLPHAPGLWLACGYASHGLTWSALAGDVIAAMLNAEPVPLERDLLQAVSPR